MTALDQNQDDDLTSPRRGLLQSRRILTYVISFGLINLAGFALANLINTNTVEKGSGIIDLPSCLDESEVAMDYSTAASGATSITGVRVSGVTSQCSGFYISLKMLNSSGETVDEVIWNPTLSAGDTSITLRADGSTTSGSNSSSVSVSTVWPISQSSPEGLQSVAAADVEEVRFSVFSNSRAATS